jgi:hypothetical protein
MRRVLTGLTFKPGSLDGSGRDGSAIAMQPIRPA